MAPEQAQGPRGRQARGHLGVWRRALRDAHRPARCSTAKTSPITLAAVLTRRRRAWTRCRRTSRRALRALLRRCLVRDPKQRLRDIGDARLDARADHSPARPRRRGVAAASATRRQSSPRGGARCRGRVAGALGVALVSALVVWAPWRATPAPAPRRLLASIGVDASLVTDRGAAAILSPDGTTLVFSARQDSQPRLFIRKLDQLAGDAARRHRRGRLPVLFAGRPVDRVLRRDQAEEGVGGWRRAGRSVRCRSRVAAGRGPTTTRSSSVPRVEPNSRAPARAGGRRDADAVRHPQSGSDDATLAPGASRRQGACSTRSSASIGNFRRGQHRRRARPD